MTGVTVVDHVYVHLYPGRYYFVVYHNEAEREMSVGDFVVLRSRLKEQGYKEEEQEHNTVEGVGTSWHYWLHSNMTIDVTAQPDAVTDSGDGGERDA